MDQLNLNMRQRRWLDVVDDYDCDILYHPGKTNVVAHALSLKAVSTLIGFDQEGSGGGIEKRELENGANKGTNSFICQG